MSSALLSGAGGFIGRALAAHLRRRGATVTTVGLREGQALRSWCEALEREAPDTVFHLAGAMTGNEAELREVNLGLTFALFEALRHTGGRPLVVIAGSAAEYGDAVIDGRPVRETTTCAPLSAYGRSKLMQTQAALALGAELEMRVLATRIFNPIGPGMPRHLALGDFARQIAAMPCDGGTLVTGDLDVSRDMLHVEDVARILADLAERSAIGVCNVCAGRPTPLRSLVEAMIAASGKPVALVRDPARIRPGERRVIVGSTGRLRALGVKLPRHDLRNACESIQIAFLNRTSSYHQFSTP